MTARKARPAVGDAGNPAQPYGVLGDDGVVRVVMPVRRYRVLFTDGTTVDVETPGPLDSRERGILVARYGPISGVSDGMHVGWTGPMVDAVLNLPPGSPRSDETGSPGTNGAGKSLASSP